MAIVIGLLLVVVLFASQPLIKVSILDTENKLNKARQEDSTSKSGRTTIGLLQTRLRLLVLLNTIVSGVRKVFLIVVSALGVYSVIIVLVMIAVIGLSVSLMSGLSGGVRLNSTPTNSSDSEHLSADNSSWLSSCDSMSKWYFANIHTYQGSSSGRGSGSRTPYECELLDGMTVGDDCSGLVASCLAYSGLFTTYTGYSSAPSSTGFDATLQSCGFTEYPCTLDFVLKAGDILQVNGHIEIVARVDSDGTCWRYSWGSIPSSMPIKVEPCYGLSSMQTLINFYHYTSGNTNNYFTSVWRLE